MAKKKPEMTQVYGQNNEFVFGETGGRGKNLSLFLKNLSLTGSSQKGRELDIRQVNSSIYGNMAYDYPTPQSQGPQHFRRNSPSRTSSAVSRDGSPLPFFLLNRSVSLGQKPTYKDMDEDWDAKVDENASKRRLLLHAMDSLHPDLLFHENRASLEKPKVLMEMQEKAEHQKRAREAARRDKFAKLLVGSEGAVKLADLRLLSWNGIPKDLRAITWQLLLGYLPANRARQSSNLIRKRQDYTEGIAKTLVSFDYDLTLSGGATSGSHNRDNSANKEKQLYHQINIDVKRTNPTSPLYAHAATQKSLRRILYLWATRHPASGYVQGINDLCTPFYQIFLLNYLWQIQQKGTSNEELFIPGLLNGDPEELAIAQDPELMSLTCENFDPGRLSASATAAIEADTYWCILRLLDNITNNYIHEQPGIIKQVNDLQTLILRIDQPLLQHLEKEGIQFIQFAFRWMNCLLMRELHINLIIRMWDTYLSETPLGFSSFHVYVCAAFLIKFTAELKAMEFQDIIMFLQNPPTSTWLEKDIELMLSEAFIWQSLYRNAGAHLR